MSNTKHLADLLKVCSILPALAIMPAMAGTGITTADDGGIFEYNNDSDMYTMVSDGTIGGFSGYDASDRFEAAVIFVGKGQQLSVSDGATIQNNKAQVGGAIAVTGNAAGATLNIGQGVKFLNNAALFDGGAIGNYGNTIVANGVLFQGNKAQLDPENNENQIGGGAISLGSTSKTSIVNTDFIGNESGFNGGAIGTRLAEKTGGGHNDNSAAILKIVGGEFEGNKANGYKNSEGKQIAGNGGAIYNTFYADVTVDGTHFEGNYAARKGGAIYNDGTADDQGKGGVMTVKSAEFEDNNAYYGGAVFNYAGKMNILGTADERVVFEDNTAYVGGAFADMQNVGSETVIKNAIFKENHAAADAGAAGLYGKVDIENTVFHGNTAAITVEGLTADVANSDGGGAIMVGGTSDVALTNVRFENNESGARGGAISARHGLGYELDINGATFTTNKSGNFGGGIANVFGGAVNMDNVEFTSNSAVRAGGAIFNGKDINYGGGTGSMSTNHGVLNLAGTNTFAGNYAGEFGGAIYNDDGGTINVSGTNTFTNNKHGDLNVANDIYNLGVVNIQSGTTTLDGGIDGTGTLTIAKDAVLNIGTATINQADITLDGTLFATVRDGDAQLNITGNFDGNGSVKLAFAKEGTYHVFGGQVFGNVDVSSSIFDLNWSDDSKDLTATVKSVDEIISNTGLTDGTAQMIANISQSDVKALNDLGLKIQETLVAGDVKAVEEANKAINPEKASVVQSTAASVQNTVSSLAANRMSAVASVGRSGGDVDLTGVAAWAQGLYNKTKLNGQFNGYTRGIAAGMDGIINGDITVGIGYAFNNSDISLASRDTDIDSHSVFVYGQYKPAAWYVNAMLNYTMSDYTETGDALGMAVSADYKTNAFGGQIAAGYDFEGGITPEFAVRYLHVNSADYTNSIGIKNELDSADYLTAVLGTKYGLDFETDNGLMLRPEVRYAVKYDMISDKSSATVAMPGVSAYTLSGERLSRVGAEFGMGLTMKYNELDVSLSYDIEVREDYTSQTGMLKARYNF